MAKVIDAILRLKDNFTPTLSKAQDGLVKYSKQCKQVGRDVQRMGNDIKGVGATLTASVTAPIVGVGVAGLKTAMDFDSAMSKVQGISMSTAEDLEVLRKKALEMGASTKFSASQSAEAMSYMAMAGWKTEQMIDGIEGVMNLASASGEDLATVTDILTDAMTGFGMGAKDAGKFADILASASSNANTNVAMMGETFKYVTPIAGAMKYTAEDTALAIGLMANAGIKSSQAGTSLRTMMTKLTGDLKIVSDSMGTVTIKTANADGTMKPFRETLMSLRSAFKTLSDEEKVSTASMLVGQEAMSGLLAIVNSSSDDFNKLMGAIDNSSGSAKEMSDIMEDNLSGQITKIMSGMQGLAIQIGDRLTPYAEKLANVVQKLVDKFSSLSDEQKDQVAKFAFMAVVIPPVIMIFGTIVSIVGKCISAFGKFGGAVKSAGGILSAIFSPANKIVLIMTAIALVVLLVMKYWTPLTEFFGNLFENIGNIIDGAIERFNNFTAYLGSVFTEAWTGMWTGIYDTFSNIFNGIKEVAKNVINSVIGFINGAINGINKFTNIQLPDFMGGGSIGFTIPEIPKLYKGTDNWQGGTAMIHDKGAEIVDLPRGSRVIPHDESLQVAKAEGMKQGAKVNIAKLADTIVVREEADIDRIANALYSKFKKQAFNMA